MMITLLVFRSYLMQPPVPGVILADSSHEKLGWSTVFTMLLLCSLPCMKMKSACAQRSWFTFAGVGEDAAFITEGNCTYFRRLCLTVPRLWTRSATVLHLGLHLENAESYCFWKTCSKDMCPKYVLWSCILPSKVEILWSVRISRM